MRYIIPIIAITVLFAACKPGSADKQKNADLKTAMLPYIEGTWVMTDYINDLKTTRSPLASSAKLKGVVSMIITKELVQGDSLPVSASLNNHEGLSFYIIFKQGQNDKQVTTDLPGEQQKTNSYELGYAINGKDTSVILYEYDNNKKVVSQRSFTKVTGPQTEDSEPYGIQYIANQHLVAGSYEATDDKGKKTTMEFTPDGLLKSVEGHTTYFIFTDFVAEEPGYMVDELCFDEHSKTQKPFIFRINADTVLLYEAKENEERTKISQGPLKYTLVKK